MQRSITKQLRRFAVPLSLVLLAYLLRTVTLDLQSFWVDEVYAVWFIDRPLEEALHLIITPDNNGPLYFLFLWGWYRLTGPSDFAVRYLSMLFSVLTVATLWQLSKTWFGRRAAGEAALLIALSPFAIWFGQEAKMYALHMFLVTLATLLLTYALRRNRWHTWLAYVLAINLLGYSHFFGAFTIAAHGIIVLGVTWRDWRRLRSYLLTMFLTTLAYIPVLRFAWRILPHFQPRDSWRHFTPLHQMLKDMLTAYTFRVAPSAHGGLWLGLMVFAVLWGILAAWRYSWRKGLALSGMLCLPALIFYPVSFKIPAFDVKYLSASFPFLMLTLALAIETLHRRGKAPALLALCGLSLLCGWAQIRDLTQPDIQRTDWRYVATYLKTHGQPDDVIVVFADYMDRVLAHYYDGPIPIFPYPYDPATPELLYDELAEGRNPRTLWLVLHHDTAMAPNHRLIEAAGARYPQITGQYPTAGQIKLLGYAMRWRSTQLPEAVTPGDARFANGLRLVGYHVDAVRLPPTEKVAHPPSNWIHLTTYWQRWGTATPQDIQLVAHLEDQWGNVWGAELTRSPTVFNFDPPAQWDAGTIVEAQVDINLNPVTPPGMYQVSVALAQPDGELVQLDTGDTNQVVLTSIKIQP